MKTRGWQTWTARWWSWSSGWRWRVVRPLAWQLAGLRDRLATWWANRSRDVVR